MSEPLQVTPDALRHTAQDLADLSSHMKTILSTLQNNLAEQGQPWGDDTTGKNFADGPNGYLAQADWVASSIGAKTDLLDQYAQQLTTTADTLEQQDQS